MTSAVGLSRRSSIGRVPRGARPAGPRPSGRCDGDPDHLGADMMHVSSTSGWGSQLLPRGIGNSAEGAYPDAETFPVIEPVQCSQHQNVMHASLQALTVEDRTMTRYQLSIDDDQRRASIRRGWLWPATRLAAIPRRAEAEGGRPGGHSAGSPQVTPPRRPRRPASSIRCATARRARSRSANARKSRNSPPPSRRSIWRSSSTTTRPTSARAQRQRCRNSARRFPAPT